MTARATIFGDDIKNTLVVPLTAVRTDKQGEYVYVIKMVNLLELLYLQV